MIDVARKLATDLAYQINNRDQIRERNRERYRAKKIDQHGSVAIRCLDRSIEARLSFKSCYVGDCIVWTGATDKAGYGRINFEGENRLVHRVAYELLHGPIPKGLELDHLCRNPICFNTAHLEAVTRSVNTRRGNLALVLKARADSRTQCKNNHELSSENTIVRIKRGYQYRLCRECINEGQRNRKVKRK